MSTRKINFALLGLLVALVALNWWFPENRPRPNYEFLPNMVHSPAYGAFARNPNFPDGKTLQPPVPGTILRGSLPLHYAATPQDALRAGEELRNPDSASDAAALERGAAVFTTFCQPCHGPGGTGNGPVAARGYPPPASLVADRALKMKDGQMFHILTYGQGNMPSYAGQLSREDRWKAILQVRSLQQKAAPAVPPHSSAASALGRGATAGGGQ